MLFRSGLGDFLSIKQEAVLKDKGWDVMPKGMRVVIYQDDSNYREICKLLGVKGSHESITLLAIAKQEEGD